MELGLRGGRALVPVFGLLRTAGFGSRGSGVMPPPTGSARAAFTVAPVAGARGRSPLRGARALGEDVPETARGR